VGNTQHLLCAPLRYLYYRSEESPEACLSCEQSPTQSDFAYFAFTIGTSVAVSDVDVTGDAMRRAVLDIRFSCFSTTRRSWPRRYR
jgi:uncharacterized membrane protein